MGKIAVFVLAAVNLLAFLLFGIDKRRSRRSGARRIPERRLLLTAALGGGAGALLGMYVFHHKTKHNRFRFGLPLLFLAQLALLCGIACHFG